MSLNNTELSIVLKEITENNVADTVNRTALLKSLIPTEGEINARGVYVYAKVFSNYALKWFAEGGIYPVGGNARRVKMSAQFKRLAISSQLTRDVLEGADKEAIINVVSEEIMDDTLTASKELSQQLYGDGSGVKAIVASVSSETVTFRVGVGDLTPDVANYGNTYGTSLLKERGRYNFISGDGASDRDAGTGGTQTVAVGSVLPIVATSNVATLQSKTSGSVAVFDDVPDAANVLLDGDMIVYEGSYNQSVTGLDAHISSGTGTYQGITRGDYPTLRCYTLNAANSGLSVAMLYKLVFQMKYLRGRNLLNENYIMLSSPAQVHAYALLGDISTAGTNGSTADTNLEIMPNAGLLDYGFKTYKFAGLNWVEDEDCPPHKLFVIMPSMLKIKEFKPLSPVLQGDNGFAPVPAFTSAGVGSYSDNAVYTMTWKGNLVTNDPARAGMKIDNLGTSGLALPTNGFTLT